MNKPLPLTEQSDEIIKSATSMGHMGLGMAWRGDFDDIWDNAPDLDGRPQRELFFENVMRWLPVAEAEALRRNLHMKK